MTTLNFNHELISLQTKLSQYAYRLTANKDEAKDLLQETLLKALVYETKFEQYTNLKAWTYTIMKNIFINSYHRAIRQNTAFDNTVDLYYLNQSKDTINETPDTSYAVQELNHIIDTLSDEFKVPFKMHTEGYKYTEISETLQLKLGTVKSRIFFTRKKLMDALKGYR